MYAEESPRKVVERMTPYYPIMADLGDEDIEVLGFTEAYERALCSDRRRRRKK